MIGRRFPLRSLLSQEDVTEIQKVKARFNLGQLLRQILKSKADIFDFRILKEENASVSFQMKTEGTVDLRSFVWNGLISILK